MSEHSADWRRTPRKRVLVPGRPAANKFGKLSPFEQRKQHREAAERRRARHAQRWAAEKARINFERAFKRALVKALDAAAAGNVEAARPAPEAGDRAP